MHTSTLVVDCSRDVMKEHCYWPIVSDLINILAHKSVAKVFVENETLLIFWFELMAYFQGIFTDGFFCPENVCLECYLSRKCLLGMLHVLMNKHRNVA